MRIQPTQPVLFVAKLQLWYWGAFVFICALTQDVGITLAALVFIVVSSMWPSSAMIQGLGWSRRGYLIAGVFTPWMAWNAAHGAEFFQEILYFASLAGILLYLVSLSVLCMPETREFFRARSREEGARAGKGFSVLALSVCSFVFAWGWTDFSATFHLLGAGDYQGIAVAALDTVVGLGLATIVLRIWWAGKWRNPLRIVWLSTGGVLFEHALCYSAITALVYTGGDPFMQQAASHTGPIIAGRFVFAFGALVPGALLSRSAALEGTHERKDSMFGFFQRRKCAGLLSAIDRSDVSGIRRALGAGADPNCLDQAGWPCIAKAASSGNVDIARALLDAHAIANQKCPAVLDERQQGVYEELCRRGLQAWMPSDSWSALLEAVCRGNLSIVNLLLKHGADANLKYSAKLDPDMYVNHSVSQSMGSQVALDTHRKDGWTALMEAAQRGHAGITEALLLASADFCAATKDGTTALMCAATEGHATCVRALLAKGAAVDQTNGDGWTALFCACGRGHVPVIEMLLGHNADANKKNRANATPLMWAVNGGPGAVKALLTAGVRVNEVSNKGGSALMAAVLNRLPVIVRSLLDAGADATIRDKNGVPLVELAQTTFHPEIIEMISRAAG